MKINILNKNQQAKGEFNGGEILENKPIGFPQEGGQKPYSNLFYWAHAWTDRGSLIGEHPHKGFEIMSIVLEGDIEHYDSSNQKWIPLKKGDVQIIRAGSGITHAEQLNEGSHMFQIWFDPDLTKTLGKPPSYDDYRSEQFPIAEKDGLKIKTIRGQGSPLQMDAPGISILEIEAAQGSHRLEIDESNTGSIYLIEGKISVGNSEMVQDDFAMISETSHVDLTCLKDSRMLLITSPAKIGYTPYLELFNR